MNIAPVLRISGVVHTASDRHVPAVAAAPAERNEDGQIVRDAVEARDAYDVVDFHILTDGGGFAEVIMRADDLVHLGGVIPNKGDRVDWPVRVWMKWAGQPGRRYRVAAFSVYGDALASQVASAKRLAPTG